MPLVTAYGFNGMKNLPVSPAYLLDDKRRITPHLIINADVADDGVVLKRTGYTQHLSLSGVHSLAGEEKGLSVMLGVAAGVLYRFEGNVATPLAAVAGLQAQVTYQEINNQIFMSTPFWNGVYDLITVQVNTWGLPVPPAPVANLVEGDLAPGLYSLCFTRLDGNRISGNGPPVQVAWDGMIRGIQLQNLEDGLAVWVTQPNGGNFFLAQVDENFCLSAITAQPLISQGIIPPPPFSHFVFAFGRFWGVAGANLYHSEPNELGDLGWFSRRYDVFPEELIMVAATNDGLFLNSLKNTWYLDGTDPAQMTLKRVGEGALPGSLTMAPLPANIARGIATSQVFAAQSLLPVPVWLARTGFVVGAPGGNLTHLTHSKVSFSLRQRGAALVREIQGLPQILMSQSGLAESDETENEIQTMVLRGSLCPPGPVALPLEGGMLSGGSLN